MNKSDEIKNLATALNKAQSIMGGAVKDAANPFFKSKYADLGAVVKAIKDPFADNGLSYVQFPIEDNGRIGVETIIMHNSGEWMSNSFTVQLTKQDAQQAGSALTYCRRYALQAIAGIPSEDDDGNSASKQGSQITTNQTTTADLDRQWVDSIKAGRDKLENIVDNAQRDRVAKELMK
jgi:hypothetical protein